MRALKGFMELEPEELPDSLSFSFRKNSLFQIEVNRENAERILEDIHPTVMNRFLDLNLKKLGKKLGKGKILSDERLPGEEAQFSKIHSAHEFVEQANLAARSLFSKAYELAKEDNDKHKLNDLKKISENYGKNMGIDDGEIPSTALNSASLLLAI